MGKYFQVLKNKKCTANLKKKKTEKKKEESNSVIDRQPAKIVWMLYKKEAILNII